MNQGQNTKRTLATWLRDNEALRAFNVLESKCAPDELIEAMAAVGLAHEICQRRTSPKAQSAQVHAPAIRILEDSFDDQMGFDRKELKTVIARMRTCAKNVKRLRVSVLIRELSGAYPANEDSSTQRTRELRKVLSNLRSLRSWHSTMPFRLDQLADAAEFATKTLSFRRRPLYDEALASLVRYVHERTRSWHDQEVSILVKAVTGCDSNYTADNLRRWRMTHRKLCGM